MMTKEVKELLDNLKEVWISPDGDYINNELDERQTNLLLNYITNLQEERENLVHIVANKIIVDYDIDTPLKEALNNERQRYIVLSTINNDLQQRIDKAIKFIKENAGYDEEISSCCDDLLYSDCDKLIELLGGNE